MSLEEQFKIVREWYGDNFTALLCGITKEQLESWANGEAKPDRQTQDSIRVAYKIWKLLRHYDEVVAKTWLSSENAELDNFWPLMLIKQYPQAVLECTNAWVERGRKTVENIEKGKR